MWFNNYRFEHKPNSRWRHVKKVAVPDRVIATLIADYLAKTTGEHWRVLTASGEVCNTESK